MISLAFSNSTTRSIFDLEEMGEIWMLIQSRKAQLDRLRYLLAIEHGQVSHPIEQHGAIVDALEAQDSRAAIRELARSSGRAADVKRQRVSDR